MRILVIESEPKVTRTLVKGLEADHFAVDFAVDGKEGLQLATEIDYDALIVSLDIEKLSGIGVIKKLRKSGSNMRILALVRAQRRAHNVRTAPPTPIEIPPSSHEIVLPSYLRQREITDELLSRLENTKESDYQATLRAFHEKFLVALGDPFAENTEQLLNGLKRVLFVAEKSTPPVPETVRVTLNTLIDLCATMRNQKVPASAVKILAKSSVARKVAEAVLNSKSLSPSELATHIGKSSQNLVAIEREMTFAGLLRRDEFGRNVRYSATPMLRTCIQIVTPEPEQQFATTDLISRITKRAEFETTSVAETVAALQAGADDCLSKPFNFEELLARVHALLRRPTDLLDKITVEDLELDRMRHMVTRDGKQLNLTQREYAVLEYLMRNAGRTVTRTMVVEHVWNLGFEGLTNIVDEYISYLRAKVDQGFKKPLIHTATNKGFILSATPEA